MRKETRRMLNQDQYYKKYKIFYHKQSTAVRGNEVAIF